MERALQFGPRTVEPDVRRLSDMRVIVEGIETEAQAARARELGIELGQGFLFARPAQLGQLTFS